MVITKQHATAVKGAGGVAGGGWPRRGRGFPGVIEWGTHTHTPLEKNCTESTRQTIVRSRERLPDAQKKTFILSIQFILVIVIVDFI